MPDATWVTRGITFSEWSEDSMRNSCMPPILSMGRTAIAMTMMPMPPSHCSKARHSKIPFGAVSSVVITVEPVVVMPDIASKKESVKLNPNSENANGSAENVVNTSQLPVVRMNA